MLSEPIQELLKDLNVSMSLRKPQQEALTVFAEAIRLMNWEKTPNFTQQQRQTEPPEQVAQMDARHKEALSAQLERIREQFKTVTSFEREFPSICFSLATGVGKTRLMAACMAYLHRVKKVNNFFVVAPNKTIYDKLRRDFSQSYPDKYVFSGLYDFVQQPEIIDGDNFNSFTVGQGRLVLPELSKVSIHIFNIAKLTHGRGMDAEMARVMRLHEVLGQSYFDYLRGLPDLCVMMDESHHYHAEQGFGVINDLNPIIGVEFTATPQIQSGKGKVEFKNIVYEYSLAHALNDKRYVKEPVVWTRRDFDPKQYTEEQLDREKLADGIKLHIDTRARLDVYARNYKKPFVKPFVLVVARDINHSRQIREFLTSSEFYNGYYADKVLEINSKQGKVESDENTELLLGLERADNQIEIVIHVNKLKEGWDVTNLYTIIPLRTSASETLTEQTIGRGLRLPYGARMGIDEIDRLSIVSHEKFQAIVELANDPNSLVRRVNYIDPSLVPDIQNAESETIELEPAYQTQTSQNNLVSEIIHALGSETPEQTRAQMAAFVSQQSSKLVVDSAGSAQSFSNLQNDKFYNQCVTNEIYKQTQKRFPGSPVSKEQIEKAVKIAVAYCVEALTNTVIPIPELVINPMSVCSYRFDDFKLNMNNLLLRPSGDTMLGRELSEGGQTIEFTGGEIELPFKGKDSPENEIAKYIIVKDNIDYRQCRRLIYSLIEQAKQTFLGYLSPEDTEKTMRGHARIIGEAIYAQMNEHFHDSVIEYRAEQVRPFSRIETSFGSKVKADAIYDFNVTVQAGDIRQRVFKGFKKACHTLYKFDSLPELNFTRVLEQDSEVIKWLRPAPKQFNLYWGKSGLKYEPDFVVETADTIYMVEVKALYETTHPDVLEKARAGQKYCKTASGWNAQNNGKPWEYALIADTEIHLQSSFEHLVHSRSLLN